MIDTKKVGVGRANARLFLFGENLDWMNGQCITTSIPGMQTEVEAEIPCQTDQVSFIVRASDEIDGKSKRLSLTQMQREFGERLCECSLSSWRDIKGRLPHTGLKVRSNVMLEGGLASSSSLCVAAIRALSAAECTSETTQEVAAAAFTAEKEFAKVPCGRLDHMAVQIGGCTLFDFGKEKMEYVRLTVPDRIFFLVVSTGVPESFLKVGQKLHMEWRNQSPNIAQFHDDSLALVREFIEFARCSKIDATRLGELLTSAQECANRFHGSENQRVEEIMRICSRYGSLGGKCSGMRRGGGVAFCVFGEPIQLNLLEELAFRGFTETHQFEWTNV